MNPQTQNKNVAAVRRLYEARGNPDIVKTVLAPEVRWEVVEGFPHSGVYQGQNGVFDFFTQLFGDFEDWHTEPTEIFEMGDRVVGLGFYSARGKRPAGLSRPASRTFGRRATASSLGFNNARTRCNSRKYLNKTSAHETRARSAGFDREVSTRPQSHRVVNHNQGGKNT